MKLFLLKKIIITSLISFCTIGVLVFFFILISNNIRSYRDDLDSIIANIASSNDEVNRLVRISDTIKNRKMDIQRLQNLVIDRQRPLRFIETIEQIGRLTNTKIALNVSDAKGNTNSLVFNATLEGQEEKIRMMLALIQTLPYQISIEGISFQRGTANTFQSNQEGSSGGTRLLLTMRVNTQQ